MNTKSKHYKIGKSHRDCIASLDVVTFSENKIKPLRSENWKIYLEANKIWKFGKIIKIEDEEKDVKYIFRKNFPYRENTVFVISLYFDKDTNKLTISHDNEEYNRLEGHILVPIDDADLLLYSSFCVSRVAKNK
jgi:hypothetical protein